MVSTNDLKTGITIKVDDAIYQVIEFQHVKPGKGSAFVRTKLRNLRTGTIIDKTFNSGIDVEQANIDKSEMQYLYVDGDMHVFMNNETYEQVSIPENQIAEELKFITLGDTVQVKRYGQEILGIELPDKVILEVVRAPGGVRGNTASNATKEVETNTGLKLSVPLFVKTGDKIVVSTATGKYDTRAK